MHSNNLRLGTPTVIMLISLRMKMEYSKCPINLKSPEKELVSLIKEKGNRKIILHRLNRNGIVSLS